MDSMNNMKESEKITEKTGKKISGETNKKVSGEVLEGIGEEVPEGISGEIPEGISEGIPEGISEEIKSLSEKLNAANKAYYQEGREIISNLEYDKLYDRLLTLEKESGIILSSSPTQKVGYEVVSELPKERHDQPMLSLNKTKDVLELKEWLKDQPGVLSWKLDGLTIVLSYEGGSLSKGVTRGNGEVGEVVTQNVRVFDNVPIQIPFKGKLTLRGEAIITYPDFYALNEEIPEAEAKYKNPRNLCSGSVRQLDPGVTGKRHVKLIAFSLISCTDENGNEKDFKNSFSARFEFLKEQGFSVVEYRIVDRDNIEAAVSAFSKRINDNAFPSDGLVLCYENIEYGLSLGRTAKFPRNAIAFKWSDEEAVTVLREVEWSPSRTGLINPIACFDPVELEGSTVTRASLHNLSYCEDFKLGIGDEIKVYKANMIIPQLSENLTRSGTLTPPPVCPACGGQTIIKSDNDSESRFLYCENPACPAKRIKNFTLFVSRDALNIEGMSEATLEKFIGKGFIKDYSDLFLLHRYREEIINMSGFGEKSYERLITSAKKASETQLYRVLYGLGIAGIGLQNARMLCWNFHNDLSLIREATVDDFLRIDGIGTVLAENIIQYFKDEEKMESLDKLLPLLSFTEEEQEESYSGGEGESDGEGEGTEGQGTGRKRILEGKSVVITGSLNHFANRNELKALIEKAGGRAAGSVSKKTAYLVNNDISSGSGKNKKAKELGVPIVSEDEFLRILNIKDL